MMAALGTYYCTSVVTGAQIDCDSVWNIWDPTCWGGCSPTPAQASMNSTPCTIPFTSVTCTIGLALGGLAVLGIYLLKGR